MKEFFKIFWESVSVFFNLPVESCFKGSDGSDIDKLNKRFLEYRSENIMLQNINSYNKTRLLNLTKKLAEEKERSFKLQLLLTMMTAFFLVSLFFLLVC